MISSEQWHELSRCYAFLGNSLLAPMTQTERIGLDPEFWQAFPSFEDAEVQRALDAMGNRAGELMSLADPVTNVSVEYTHLFVGPPRPFAAPWETFYGNAAQHSDSMVGFGEATFAMRQQLRDMGLGLSNENNQYEDHMGIELLCLSELCLRVATGQALAKEAVDFARQRPLSWIDAFLARIASECPDGYFVSLVAVIQSLLAWQDAAY